MLNLMPDVELGLNEEKLKEALAVYLVMHPVYRIYPTQYPLHQRDVGILKTAYHEAEKWNPALKRELKYLFHLFTEPPGENLFIAENKLYFLMRCQQFTGPLEAKGVEDTTFYLYNRLISHNEVGDSPDIFGISQQEFHERMIERQLIAPHALNATATHDTKRGEDTRIRINVISELPEQWFQAIRKWRELNQQHVKNKDGGTIPDPNDEYFIYQTICGAFPMDGGIDESFKERIKEYMLKVVREGKQNSNWASPNQIYEFGIFEFINQILDPGHPFVEEAIPFIKKITHYGIIYSLAQQLIKITAPGVPDIYQGCELWDLSLVDPDNRRPVDYEQRKNIISELTRSGNVESLIRILLDNKESGNIKLFTIFKALNERKILPELFKYGKYIPAVIAGDFKNHATGYFRNYKNQWALTIVPHHLVSFVPRNKLPLKHVWKNTHLRAPSKAPKVWKNIFTEETYGFDDNMFFKDIFATFPIVFLTGISE
jgi:(1->4)-alpha-D-glucan 1-alpha-D-glucosylmutase